MNIKLSTLSSYLHENDILNKETQEFIDSIALELGEEIKTVELVDYDCDIKLILIASGGSEYQFLSNIDILKPPYYLLTTGKNNSLAASLEIMTYLNNHSLKGEVLHGSTQYIVNRILKIAKRDENMPLVKLGVVGKPSDWLIGSDPVRADLKTKFNIDLVDIEIQKVNDLYAEIEPKVVDTDEFDPLELANANKVYKALARIQSEYGLNGLTIRCFDLIESIHTTSCLALARLNSLGIIGACEGDIMAMISMYLVKRVFDQSSFQANPTAIDIENNIISFAHCTCPLDMVESFKYDTHFESGIGVAIKGEFKPTYVTIFRLSSDLKHYYVGEGRLIENGNDERQCRSQMKIRMFDSVAPLLKEPCGNHHIVFYGLHRDRLKKYLDEIL